MSVTRKERRDIRALDTIKTVIMLSPGQYFCELPKSYEIWQEGELPRRLKVIPKRRVALLWTK